MVVRPTLFGAVFIPAYLIFQGETIVISLSTPVDLAVWLVTAWAAGLMIIFFYRLALWERSLMTGEAFTDGDEEGDAEASSDT